VALLKEIIKHPIFGINLNTLFKSSVDFCY